MVSQNSGLWGKRKPRKAGFPMRPKRGRPRSAEVQALPKPRTLFFGQTQADEGAPFAIRHIRVAEIRHAELFKFPFKMPAPEPFTAIPTAWK